MICPKCEKVFRGGAYSVCYKGGKSTNMRRCKHCRFEFVEPKKPKKSPWKPIETCQIEPFNASEWYKPGKRYLLWVGHHVIGQYAYTKKGKGRWLSATGTIYPTHWMHLPDDPPKGEV